MKRSKRRLAIIMTLMLIFTSFEFVGVFAEGEENTPAEAPATVEEAQDTEEVAVPEESTEAPAAVEEETSEGEADASEEDAPAITTLDEEVKYTITYTAGDGGTVSLASEENVAAGAIQGSTATPDDGYSFVGWFFGSEAEAFSTDKVLTAEAIIAKLAEGTSGSFRAEFEENAIAINNLKALASCKCVHLRWKNPAPADKVAYTISFNGKTVEIEPGKATKLSGGWYEYVAKDLSADINCLTGKYPSYTFTVTATDENDSTKTATAKVSGAPVRTIAYKIKIKTAGTLKSHYDKNGKTSTKGRFKVKKGQTIYAYGYGFGGKYVFRDSKGYVFFCNLTRTSAKASKCVYRGTKNYTNEEATLFINDSKVGSKNNSLVWVNTYTQHIYLFKGKKGNWKISGVNDECSTGKATAPSPTAYAGMRTVQGYIAKRHGIKYWTRYADINSIHGKKAKWKMGKPASNGCVRNYPKNAEKIYKNTKKGSRIYIY